MEYPARKKIPFTVLSVMLFDPALEFEFELKFLIAKRPRAKHDLFGKKTGLESDFFVIFESVNTGD